MSSEVGQRGGEIRVSLADADVLIAYSVAISLAAVVGKWVGEVNPAGAGLGRIFELGDVNAGEALAVWAMASLALSARGALRLRPTGYFVLAAAALFFLPPSPQNLPFVGATLAGVYFWRLRRDSPALSSLGQLWIAIAVHAAWGRVLFRIMSVPILQLETLTIAKLGQGLGLGLTVNGAELSGPSGWSVYILDPCSCFHNLSLAALVWLSLLKLAREPTSRKAWTALLIGALLIILLNASRILLMTLSEPQYLYWHDGSGRSYFLCLSFLAIALPTLLALRRDRRRQGSATAF